jgi:hypothetical protein
VSLALINPACPNRSILYLTLVDRLQQIFPDSEVDRAKSISILTTLLSLPANTKTNLIFPIISAAVALPEEVTESELLLILAGSDRTTLSSFGLTEVEAQTAIDTALEVINVSLDTPFEQTIIQINRSIVQTIADSNKQKLVTDYQKSLQKEIAKARDPKQKPSIAQGDVIQFEFILKNEEEIPATIQIPNAANLQQNFTGMGQVTGVSYQLIETNSNHPVEDITDNDRQINLAPNSQLKLIAKVTVGELSSETINYLNLSLGIECGKEKQEQSAAILGQLNLQPIDPIGEITGCKSGIQYPDIVSAVKFIPQGITDSEGNSVITLGILTDALQQLLTRQGLTTELADRASIKALETFLALAETVATNSLAPTIKAAIAQITPEQSGLISRSREIPFYSGR